jgi:hypothetical protein
MSTEASRKYAMGENGSQLLSLRTALTVQAQNNADLVAALDRLTQLEATIKGFAIKHRITCPESIHQRDNPTIEAPSLVEELLDIVGYYPSEDE